MKEIIPTGNLSDHSRSRVQREGPAVHSAVSCGPLNSLLPIQLASVAKQSII
jgi:hypothetical protein